MLKSKIILNIFIIICLSVSSSCRQHNNIVLENTTENTTENTNNLDTWVGEYSASFFYDENIIEQIIDCEIFLEDGEYLAKILVSNAHAQILINAYVIGDETSIKFYYTNTIFNDTDLSFDHDDLLFELEKKDDVINTLWHEFKPSEEILSVGRYFEEIALDYSEENYNSLDYSHFLKENIIENNLNNWIGRYNYYEFIPPNINYDMNINIYRGDNGTIAKVTIDGFQTAIDVTANVYGNEREVFLVYDYNNYPERPNSFESNDILLSLKLDENNKVLTYWGEIQPIIEENKKSGGVYFKKIS